MNNTRSIVVIFLIGLIAAAFWGAIRYFNILEEEQRSPALPARQDQSAAVIHITAQGFDPPRVEIGKGETVEFVNEDAQPHWPASAVHPLHTQCPGFDALHGLAQGERYRYTFLKSQTCPFHDHLNPFLFSGVITIK